MGFEAGIAAWSRFLKPGERLIVSDGEGEYTEIDVAYEKYSFYHSGGAYVAKTCEARNQGGHGCSRKVQCDALFG